MSNEAVNNEILDKRGSGHCSLFIVPLFILLLAFAFRTWQLTAVPPGLTHDEANHGREAIGILDGELYYFFPLNYGSEPIYSYTVAGMMAAVGEHLLALRLVNVYFGVLAIALTYAWATRVLDRQTALLAAALLALSFWPLASSREALRAGMLPFFMLATMWFFWQIVGRRLGDWETARPGDPPSSLSTSDVLVAHSPLSPAPLLPRSSAPLLLCFGLSIAATFHTYLAARVTWTLFPLFLGYLALWHRPRFRRSWRPILGGLLLAGLLAIPMALYLRAHPEMQTRVSMLDRPLEQLRTGEWRPLLENAGEALLAFVWPGYGDQFLAYNIPGRPVLDIVTAVFFLLGIAVCLWRWRQPVYAFLLMWWGVGILPSLVTGPTANTTRNLAALPPVYLLAAVGFVTVVARVVYPRRFTRVNNPRYRGLVVGAAVIWLVWAGGVSARDYFVRWGLSAEVRGAYQHTLVESIKYLDGHPSAAPLLFSSVYPGPAHDSSIALVLGGGDEQIRTARWVDARYALVIPEGSAATVVIPASTPPHPAFAPLLEPVDNVTLRADDLDPGFTVYHLLAEQVEELLGERGEPVAFGAAVRLLDAQWLRGEVQPGETAELLTAWEVLDPARAGPLVPPAFTTDAVLFTHLLSDDGGIVAQHDSLEAPSWAWQAGDVILQLHPMTIPAETSPGEYRAVVGIYDPTSRVRLEVDEPGGTTADVPPLTVFPR